MTVFTASFRRPAACAALLALTTGGCLQILGLDSYKEGQGGGAATGTTTSSSTATSSTTTGSSSTGVTSSSSSGTGGAGGGAPADCSLQGSLLTLFSDPNLNGRMAMASLAQPNTTFFAASSNGNMTPGAVLINLVQNNGQVGTAQTWVPPNGGVDVADMAADQNGVTVYVRTGGQIGELRYTLNGNQLGSSPVFTPYTDIPDAACQAPNYITDFMMQQPLDPANPHWIAVCRNQTSSFEKMYIGDKTTSGFVSQESLNAAADKLTGYFSIGGRIIAFAGGDPMSGAWYRFGAQASDLATKYPIVAETDPNRSTISLAQAPDGMGGIQVFVATLNNTAITPARMFTANFTAGNLGQITNAPMPGEKKIVDVTMLSGLGGFSPLVVSPNRYAGAGATVDQKSVLLTFMTGDGSVLARPVVRQAAASNSINNAEAVSNGGPGTSYSVGWIEGDQTNLTMYGQAVLCVGGP